MDVSPEVWADFTDFLRFGRLLGERSVYTYYNIMDNICTYMTKCGENVLTQDNMRRYLRQLIDSGCAYSTFIKHKTTLRHWLDFSKSALSVPDVRGIKRTPKKMPYLSYQQIEVILANIPDTPLGILDRAIIDLAYSTGLRRDEICQLGSLDIDWVPRIIRVCNGKGGDQRLVVFGEMAADSLNKYWLMRAPFKAKGVKGHRRNPFFLTPEQHRPLTSNWMQKLNERINRDYSPFKRRITMHDFRRAFATHLIGNGADIRDVQMLLGHASPSTTAQYVHYDKRQLERIFACHHPRAGWEPRYRRWWFRDHIPEKEFYEEEKTEVQEEKTGKKRKKDNKKSDH